jgi:hypothetical protein
VGRDSGTDRAIGGWLQRLVRRIHLAGNLIVQATRKKTNAKTASMAACISLGEPRRKAEMQKMNANGPNKLVIINRL